MKWSESSGGFALLAFRMSFSVRLREKEAPYGKKGFTLKWA